ncbi:outer membrane beta-barrel protein [Chitinophaga rhizosphaerae]|uniref:outer membrane beta-barrel protein n=1 Tax=Chitinophaga rhizosphaerae TaxID=1864947 RepID=UPI000F8112BF|nr:outer membrane beta-barrel protein [Chitinophaga rhizosphaerae]
MKKMIVMAALALFGTQFAKAQVQKGNFLVGGSVGVNSVTGKVDGSDNKNTETTFTISPKAGYALSDKWMVGVFVEGSFYTNKEKVGATTTKDKTNTIAPGVFVRNYCQIADSKVYFTSEANVSYGFGTIETNDVKTDKTSTIKANLMPGISYLVGKHLMLEGNIGGLTYSNQTIKPEAGGADTKISTLDFNFIKSFQVGVSFLF